MKPLRSSILLCGVLLMMLIGAGPQRAWGGPSPVALVNATDDFGLKGYDPVAYFISSQATIGKPEFSYPWKGVTYRFASAENLQQFKAEPEKYLPQYGGYCAYAMSINRIADIDPDRWAVVDGKLYLNNNFFSHKLWSVGRSGNITSADKNWAAWPKTSVGE